MTIEEAISYIQLQKNFWAVIGESEESSVVKSLEMALDSLRAQQEAEKNENGCKYCRDGEAIALDSCSAVTIKGGNIGGGDWECKINYCPMCGRNIHPPKEAHNV